jgi:uncharacterized protein with ParB-like and HNH nuclease domain
MKASETKLQLILEGTKQYVVPMFQRTYSWEKRDWTTLWSDLMDLLDDETPRPHFIGSIVTAPARTVPEGITKYLLIDGQQRLTTLLLLLAALRDRAPVDAGTMGQEIEESLLTNRFQKDQEHYKLLPTQGDRDSFIELIRDRGSLRADQISAAYQFFEKKLKSIPDADLDRLKNVIIGKLSLVSIVLDHDDNPHLIFESLNAKGRPLAQADLIRNYFFMRLPLHEQEKTYATLWKPMQDRLGAGLTEFIRHYLMRDGEIVKQGEIYFALKEKCDGKTPAEVLDYLRQLVDFSDFYSKLLRPDEEGSADIRDRLGRLNRIDMTVAYPFLLNVYRSYWEGKTTQGDFVAILDALENFMIRRFVCGVPTYGLNKVFPTLFAASQRKASLVEGVKAQLATKNYPRDADFVARFPSAKLYAPGERQIRTKLILELLERSFAHKEPVPFAKLTVEHVMPQSLSAWWKEHLGEECDATHGVWLDTIGNLTLTGYNSDMSNSEFDKKRSILQESHLELNKYFIPLTAWRGDTIQSRAQALTERALSVWPDFASGTTPVVRPSDVTGRTPVAVTVLGEKKPATKWRDVAQRTLEVIADLDPEAFERIESEIPKFVARDPNRLRSARELSNGVYMEVGLSAAALYNYCLQATGVAGLAGEDWTVEFA